MRVAVIGAGRVGMTLGSALRAKGHTIAYGTRDPSNSSERGAKPATVLRIVANVALRRLMPAS
jgi:predicted dinucleotide-binding enzyme